jgi:Ca-activated chloride channel homolog
MSTLPQVVFDYPWLMIAALILPLLILSLRRARARERETRLSRFADRIALHRLIGVIASTNRARTIRLVTVAVLCGLALSGPRWGVSRGPATARGIDMAIAIDASLSMLAPDEKPSRLERVKQEVRRLRAMSRADRVALIAFAGRSYILTPLTNDDGAIELFLENLDPSVVGQGGSSLSRTIRQGSDLLLASNSGADRALVIFSDGEAFEDRAEIETAAAEAGKQGISLVTVGFGTERGTTIPVRDGNVVREKRDETGQIVVTRYSPEMLDAAARAADGTFIPAEASDKASRVRAALRTLRTAQRAVDAREDHVPRFLWLLVPALLLLLYDTTRDERRRVAPAVRELGMRPAAVQPASAVLLVACIVVPMLMPACAREPDPAVLYAEGDVQGAVNALRAQIADGDSSSTVRYNLGSALLGADSLAIAAELLEGVRRNSEGEVRMRSRFNAGLAMLRIGRTPNTPDADQAMASARAAYRAFLEERPADLDAKWNFELALRKPPPNDGGGGGGGSEDPQPQDQAPNPGSLDQRQAEALLNSAARDERDVQNKKQRQGRVPPQGKDW